MKRRNNSQIDSNINDNLSELIRFLQYQNIEVNYLGSARQLFPTGNTCTGKFNFKVNGCVYMDENIIDLFADDPNGDRDMLLTVLIHEYGHIVAYQETGNYDHSETCAWEAGELSVPKEFIPSCFEQMKAAALYDYNEI